MTSGSVKITFFWDVTANCLVGIYPPVFISFYQTKRYHIPGGFQSQSPQLESQVSHYGSQLGDCME